MEIIIRIEKPRALRRWRWALLPLLALLTVAALLGGLPRSEAAHVSPTVIATVPVGTSPAGVGVNATTNRIYVVNSGSNNVSVIDGATNTELDTDGNPANGITRIPVGAGPGFVGVNATTNKIYVSNNPGSVSVIDGATNAVVATISTAPAQSLQEVGVNPITNKIYVASFDPGGRIVVINGATDTILKFIGVAANPISVGVNPATNKIYVGHGPFFLRAQITVIDGASNTVSDGPAVGLAQRGIGVNATTNRIYVNKGDPSRGEPFAVRVVDGATNAVVGPPIAVGTGAGHVGVDPITNRIYVVNGSSNDVSVIDGASATVVATIPVGTSPFGVGVNPSTDRVYVSHSPSSTLSVIGDPKAKPTAMPTASATPTATATPSAPPQINITNIGQYALPKTCFSVRDDAQNPLFVVCDNDFQSAPAAHAACVPNSVCNDENTTLGAVRVTVSTGTYHVLESKTPFAHTGDATKRLCTAVSGGKCGLTFVNSPNSKPWFPWDVDGNGLVTLFGDIFEVSNHFNESKP